MGWLEQHLEGFVKPNLGHIPKPDSYMERWAPVNIDDLITAWTEAKKKAKGRTILLPGRDVWELEILARIDGTPTIFRPDISGAVAAYVLDDYRRCYGVDSGYSGSIFRKLGMEDFGLISTENAHQLPRVNKSLCARLEGTPKYWTRGSVEVAGEFGTQSFECRIVQKLNTPQNFAFAAGITQVIALRYMQKLGI